MQRLAIAKRRLACANDAPAAQNDCMLIHQHIVYQRRVLHKRMVQNRGVADRRPVATSAERNAVDVHGRVAELAKHHASVERTVADPRGVDHLVLVRLPHCLPALRYGNQTR